MYYICKFSNIWSVLDDEDSNALPLDEAEVDFLRKRFPKYFSTDNVLACLRVGIVDPKKLNNLSKPKPKKSIQKLSVKTDKT